VRTSSARGSQGRAIDSPRAALTSPRTPSSAARPHSPSLTALGLRALPGSGQDAPSRPHTRPGETNCGCLRPPLEARDSEGRAAEAGGPRAAAAPPTALARSPAAGAVVGLKRLRTAALPAASGTPLPSPSPVAPSRLRCARFGAATAMLNPYRGELGGTGWTTAL
jgi:hypothetical protein